MNTCGVCGKSFSEDQKFCIYDGAPLEASATPRAGPGRSAALKAVSPPELEPMGDLKPGTPVGEYVVTGKVGEGGMGTVYGGLHPVIEKKVAIKVLSPAFAANQEAVSRFVTEARAVNQIAHPNIVDIFGFGQLPDGRRYFVMELLQGNALAGEARPMPYGRAFQVIDQVCDALAAAHERGIIHRDLKPDNIFLSERRAGEVTVKLLDFGIAKLMTDASGGMQRTRTGMPMGTPYYMPPEQWQAKGIDHRTDIYALGIIMYEIFTGCVPFTSDNYVEVMQGHMYLPPTPPRQLADVPEALETIVLKALEKDPTARFQSVAELRSEIGKLAPILGARNAPARSGTAPSLSSQVSSLAPSAEVLRELSQRVTPTPGPTSYFAAQGRTGHMPIRRRLPLIAGVGGAIVVGAVGLFAVLGNKSEKTPVPVAAAPALAAAPKPGPAPVAPAPVAPAPSAKARLAVKTSSPEARVLVDGVPAGRGATVEVSVEPGSHEVRVEADHYVTNTQTVLVEGSGRELEVTLAREPVAKPAVARPKKIVKKKIDRDGTENPFE